MEALMPGHNRNLKRHCLLWVALGFLCCALLVAGGIVHVVHSHADGKSLQADCALCHTAHQVVQPASAHSLPPTERVAARISAAPQPRRAQFYFVFSLLTRPPPAEAGI